MRTILNGAKLNPVAVKVSECAEVSALSGERGQPGTESGDGSPHSEIPASPGPGIAVAPFGPVRSPTGAATLLRPGALPCNTYTNLWRAPGSVGVWKRVPVRNGSDYEAAAVKVSECAEVSALSGERGQPGTESGDGSPHSQIPASPGPGITVARFRMIPCYLTIMAACVDVGDDKISRHPSQLAAATRKFLKLAREQGRPFFHNVNCYDPHRPFIGIKGPYDLAEGEPPSRRIKPEEITGVPGFLEDLPEIRRELAGYFTNVRRLDDALGAVLEVLKEEGFADNTLVMLYAGDHGMSFPFAKSNDYENSSRGALIIRWPGVTKAGSIDRDHLVSTLDFAPTLLEAAGLPPIPGIDGRSFLPAVKGGKMAGWDRVFTFYNAAFGNRWLPMRCLRTKERAYIWNAWSDGQREYRTENMAGLTWKAMVAAAATKPAIKAHTDFYLRRVPEEFYDLTNDGCERVNLIADPSRQAEIGAMREELLALMRRTGDPFAEAFAHRDNKELISSVLKKLREEYETRPQTNQKESEQ